MSILGSVFVGRLLTEWLLFKGLELSARVTDRISEFQSLDRFWLKGLLIMSMLILFMELTDLSAARFLSFAKNSKDTDFLGFPTQEVTKGTLLVLLVKELWLPSPFWKDVIWKDQLRRIYLKLPMRSPRLTRSSRIKLMNLNWVSLVTKSWPILCWREKTGKVFKGMPMPKSKTNNKLKL